MRWNAEVSKIRSSNILGWSVAVVEEIATYVQATFIGQVAAVVPITIDAISIFRDRNMLHRLN